MKIKRKIIDRAQYRFNKDLYFGRKKYQSLKNYANRILQRSAEVWPHLPMPITKEDKKLRKFYVTFAFIGGTLLRRIRDAEKYRRSIRYRHCRYKKYLFKNKIIFERTFIKLEDNSKKRVYVVLTPKKNKVLRAKLIKDKLTFEINSPPVEEGRFRFSPIFFDEFNIYFYPNQGKRYGYNFFGKSINQLTVSLIK